MDGSETTAPESELTALDAAMLARLTAIVEEATAEFDAYDHARALEITETFFWYYCDDYLELVKARAYGDASEAGPASARHALALSLSVILRLFAPFLPFCTEEAWSWWQSGSIHLARWPARSELQPTDGATPHGEMLDAVSTVLGAVRRAKTEAKVSMRARVARCTVTGPPELIDLIRLASGDLSDAGAISQLEYLEDPAASALSVTVELEGEPN
jgi:valyl-tRNA synthetase